MLKVGDSVVTSLGEQAIIEKPFQDEQNSYDWWVSLKFMFQGKEYVSFEPYSENELTKIEENS